MVLAKAGAHLLDLLLPQFFASSDDFRLRHAGRQPNPSLRFGPHGFLGWDAMKRMMTKRFGSCRTPCPHGKHEPECSIAKAAAVAMLIFMSSANILDKSFFHHGLIGPNFAAFKHVRGVLVKLWRRVFNNGVKNSFVVSQNSFTLCKYFSRLCNKGVREPTSSAKHLCYRQAGTWPRAACACACVLTGNFSPDPGQAPEHGAAQRRQCFSRRW